MNSEYLIKSDPESTSPTGPVLSFEKLSATAAIKQGRTYKDFLKADGCLLCGYNACSRVLQFHHVKTKGKPLSELHHIAAINKEFMNHPVVVLCANCHGEITAGYLDVTFNEGDYIRPIIFTLDVNIVRPAIIEIGQYVRPKPAPYCIEDGNGPVFNFNPQGR